MYQTIRGLILRSVDYREADRLLTVLTEDRGCLLVKARGVRRKNSKQAAACQLFTFSELTLYESKGRFILQEAELLRFFSGLQADLSTLSLASYLAEVLTNEAEDAPSDGAALRLGLNCLFALSEHLAPPEVIKAAFEVRYMGLSGYAPALDACWICGKREIEYPVVALEAGAVHCRQCLSPALSGKQSPLTPASRSAAQYLLQCDLKKICSFRLPERDLRLLGQFSESYLLHRMERRFRTLDFYKSAGETQ